MFEPFRCESCANGWYVECEHYCQYKTDLDVNTGKCKEYIKDEDDKAI